MNKRILDSPLLIFFFLVSVDCRKYFFQLIIRFRIFWRPDRLLILAHLCLYALLITRRDPIRSKLHLVGSNPHIDLQDVLLLYQIIHADQLAEVVAAKSLSMLLRTHLFINLKALNFIGAKSAISVLDEDVELDELHAIVFVHGLHSDFHVRLQIWIDVIRLVQAVEVEDFLEPQVIGILVINQCIDANVEQVGNGHIRVDPLSECSQRLRPTDGISRAALAYD